MRSYLFLDSIDITAQRDQRGVVARNRPEKDFPQSGRLRPVRADTAAHTVSGSAVAGSASRVVIRRMAAVRSTAAARSRECRDRYSRPWPSTVSDARTTTGSGSVTSGPSRRIRHSAASATARNTCSATRYAGPGISCSSDFAGAGPAAPGTTCGVGTSQMICRLPASRFSASAASPRLARRALLSGAPLPSRVIDRPADW